MCLIKHAFNVNCCCAVVCKSNYWTNILRLFEKKCKCYNVHSLIQMFWSSGVPGASRPGYYRGLSVPPESRSDSPKAKTAFLRSKSHPGCVKDDPNEGTLKENGLNSPKKCHSSWREKKFAKKGYSKYILLAIKKPTIIRKQRVLQKRILH